MSDERKLKFSIALVPDHPIAELLDAIELADKLGYYACYGADETFHKDCWQLFSIAATRTKNIRFGPNVTHVILNDPTLIAQRVATLDEISNGRAQCGISIGNFALLDHYRLNDQAKRPMARLREANQVLRRMLDERAIDFDGEFYRYDGLFTFAAPVQARLPVFIGAMLGPKSFQLAGEIADGMHHAVAYSKQAMDYALDNIKIGAARAKRDWRDLDLATLMITCVGADSRAAKDAAHVFAAFYLTAVPPALLERHEIALDDIKATCDAVEAGDIPAAVKALPKEISDRFSCAGTPDEIVAKIRDNVVAANFNHVVFVPADPFLVRAWSGLSSPRVLDLKGQLQLLHDEVMPAFA